MRLIPIILFACFSLAHSSPSHAQPDFRSGSMPYAAFDKLALKEIKLSDATIKVGYAPGDLKLSNDTIFNWIKKSAQIVSQYYGQFPVASLRLLIVPTEGKGVKGGQAYGHKGSAIRLYLGKYSRQEDLKNDWVAIHEMIHLASPRVNRRHLWFSEGLSVYIESIARVQSGDLTEEKIWSDFITYMPQGQPAADDRGLDNTPTWGRVYWGGAIFCLLADIELRKRTNNKIGLQSAMQAVLKQHGNNEQVWSMRQILKIADKETGQTVLTELYEDMRANPKHIKLSRLFKNLGILKNKQGIRFDDSAPMAKIRKAIVKPVKVNTTPY